mgnify:CR=1 FL=1
MRPEYQSYDFARLFTRHCLFYSDRVVCSYLNAAASAKFLLNCYYATGVYSGCIHLPHLPRLKKIGTEMPKKHTIIGMEIK